MRSRRSAERFDLFDETDAVSETALVCGLILVIVVSNDFTC